MIFQLFPIIFQYIPMTSSFGWFKTSFSPELSNHIPIIIHYIPICVPKFIPIDHICWDTPTLGFIGNGIKTNIAGDRLVDEPET